MRCSFVKSFIKISWTQFLAGTGQEAGVGHKAACEMISSIQSLSFCPLTELYQCSISIVSIIIIIIIIIIMLSSFVTGLFLNQWWSPPLRLQASHCSTLCIMCDVLSIAVFCSESTECFPGMTSIFFLKPFVNISVAPIITGIILHFRCHICCISIHKFLYFSFFSPFFNMTFLSVGIATYRVFQEEWTKFRECSLC